MKVLVFFRARAMPMAFGISQVRGQIDALAAGLHHGQATPDLSRSFDLHHSSRQCRILNPLNKARDQTHNLRVPSRICFRCATMGTPVVKVFSVQL